MRGVESGVIAAETGKYTDIIPIQYINECTCGIILRFFKICIFICTVELFFDCCCHRECALKDYNPNDYERQKREDPMQAYVDHSNRFDITIVIQNIYMYIYHFGFFYLGDITE